MVVLEWRWADEETQERRTIPGKVERNYKIDKLKLTILEKKLYE